MAGQMVEMTVVVTVDNLVGQMAVQMVSQMASN